MGTTTRILIPSLLVLCLCLLPLLTPQHVQLQLKDLIESLYPSPSTSSKITAPENQQAILQPNETKTYTLSTNPLVIYIQNFITPLEASQLVALRYLHLFLYSISTTNHLLVTTTSALRPFILTMELVRNIFHPPTRDTLSYSLPLSSTQPDAFK